MYAYASKAPTYNTLESGNLYVPRASGIEGTMAWMDSIARRHYLTVDSVDSFVGANGFNWKKFYDEYSSDACIPKTAPPYDLEGYPMYVSGFWNQFKVAAKLIGRQIGVDLDNAPYPNVSANFMWSGNAMNPDYGYGTVASRRNVNENMCDVGQIPKTYYETYIANNSPVMRPPERLGFRQVLTRNGNFDYDDREILELSVTQTQSLSVIRTGRFVARDVVGPQILGQFYGIDFAATPAFDMESYNANWGKSIGDVEWTIFYQAVRYSSIYDPHEHSDLIEGKWSWDGEGSVPASDFNGAGAPKYEGPNNVSGSGYYIDRYTETYCAVGHDTEPLPFIGENASDPGTGFNLGFGDVIVDDAIPTFPATNPMYSILAFFDDEAPSGSFNAVGDRNCDMSHYLKYSTFGAVPMSSTYDITRRLGLESDANYEFKFRHHERIGTRTPTQSIDTMIKEDFGNLVCDYWYTPSAYSDTYRKVVAASPIFSGSRGTNLFEISPGINGAHYPIAAQSPAIYGSGRFFEDLTQDFSPIIDDHDRDGYYLSVASFINPSGTYPDRKVTLYNSRGGDGPIFYTKKSSPTATAWPPPSPNVFFRSPLNPVSGVMKISGVVVAEGKLNQYDSVTTQLQGPGGTYGGFFNVEGGGAEGYTGLAGIPRSGCYSYPWDTNEGITSDTHNVNYGADFGVVHKNKFEYYSFAAEIENLKVGGGAHGELLTPEFGFPFVSGTIQEAGPTFKGRVGIAFYPSTVTNYGISVGGNGIEGPFDFTFLGDPIKVWLFPMWTRYNQYIKSLYQVKSMSNLADFPSKAHQIAAPYGYVNFVRPSSYLRCGNGYVDINQAENLFPQEGEYPVLDPSDVETVPAFYG